MVGSMKFDKVKVGKIISDINKYLRDLKEQKIESSEELKNKYKFYASSMLLFSIVNSAIDLGNEIISAKKLRMPHSYKEIFEILYEERIIDEKMKNDMVELVRIRNIIAHRYFLISPEKLFWSMKKLKSVEKFVKAVKKIVK